MNCSWKSFIGPATHLNLTKSIILSNAYTATTSEAGRVAEAVEQSVTETPFLDDSDDFIQSHIDSHLPPTEEVMEEEQEESIEREVLEDTDGDGLLDHDEKPGQQWQIEAEPPEIKKFDPEHYTTGRLGLDHHVKVTMRVTDNVGIEKIMIHLAGYGWEEKYPEEGSTNVTWTEKWDVSNWRIDEWLGSGYDVEVKVYDWAGNGAKSDAHVDGAAQKALSAIVGALEKIGKAVKEMASEAFNWIWGVIEGMLNTVLRPIKNAMKDFVQSIAEIVAKHCLNTNFALAATLFVDLILGSTLYFGLNGLFTTLKAIEIIAKPFTGTVSGIVSSAKEFIKPMIMGAIKGAIAGVGIASLSEALTKDKVMGKILGIAGVSGALISAGITIWKTWLNKKMKELGVPGISSTQIATALMGAIIAGFSASARNIVKNKENRKKLIHVLDVFAVLLDLWALKELIKNRNKEWYSKFKILFPIMSLVETAVVVGSLGVSVGYLGYHYTG